MKIQKITDKVYRGEVPITEEDFKELKGLGIKKILSLEAGWKAWFSGHMNHEIDEATKYDIDVDSIRMSDFYAPSLEDLDTAACIINKTENQPIFVHCAFGKDRTGMSIAAWRIRFCEWKWEDAKGEMYQYGFHRIPYFWWASQLKKYEQYIKHLRQTANLHLFS